ncbi:hypothetical protein ATER59S_05372 [Aquamicrobium terrae]
MADYFTHFSCLLDVGSPDNAARALDLYTTLSEQNAGEDPPSDGFVLSIQPEHGGTQLWMRDDGTGDPEHVIRFVIRCAKEFGLTGLWGMQYATTCSKPRVRWVRRRGACHRPRDRRYDGLDLYRRLALRRAGGR